MFNIPTFQKDVYKEFHMAASHPDITESYGNFTNRHNKHSNIENNKTVCSIGLQYVVIDSLINEWNEGFFAKNKKKVIKAHSRIMSAMLGYKVDTSFLEKLHDLGYLPLEIKAIEEGIFLPYGVPTFTIRNTVAGFEALPLMLETVMSQESWPISTSATTSASYLRQQKKDMMRAGMDMSMLKFMIHDFSSRGMFGKHAAAMSGFAHLAVGNGGTDTIPAVLFAEKYYGADVDKELVGVSVNATEHSITCPWKEEGEYAYAMHLMTNVAPTGILAMVADTWDFWNWVTVILPQLKDTIMARDGKLVTRPDSGDPIKILTGYTWCHESFITSLDVRKARYQEYEAVLIRGKYFELNAGVQGKELMECEVMGLVSCLWNTFGGSITDKGYKVLDQHVGAIYGDAITLKRQIEINQRLMDKGFAPQVVLGTGSYSFQMVTRDTHGSAMKATNVVKAGVDLPIAKEPKTDASKNSARGFLRVNKEEDGSYTVDQDVTREEAEGGELTTMFYNGRLTRRTTLAEIRARVAAQL